MSDQLNWRIIPSSEAVTEVIPGNAPAYDLFNEAVFQRLVYQPREYGINLGWDDPDPASPKVSFRARSGEGGAISYGERVAVRVQGGGYLRYSKRKYGISLAWSQTPVYEWRLRGDSPAGDAPVVVGAPVGLFNTVADDYLFYDPRRYGINLKWVRDKGRYNGRSLLDQVTDAVSGLIDELVNIAFEVLGRLSLPALIDLILTAFGIMLPKRILLRIVILRDEDGCALIADPRLPADVLAEEQGQLDDTVDVIKRCLKTQVNTSVSASGGELVQYLDWPAPTDALYVKCGSGALGENHTVAGRYFRSHLAPGWWGPFGYMSPVTVFIVKDIEGKIGCSLGPLTNYVVVSVAGMCSKKGAIEPRPTTAMHEIGHACGLWHIKPAWLHVDNLMKAGTPRGTRLEVYERIILRNSRHVTFW